MGIVGAERDQGIVVGVGGERSCVATGSVGAAMARAAAVVTTAVTAVATDVVTVLHCSPCEGGAHLVCPLPPPQYACDAGAPHMAGIDAVSRQKRLTVPHTTCRRDGCSRTLLMRSSVGLASG